jgi:hypothetical protein
MTSGFRRTSLVLALAAGLVAVGTAYLGAQDRLRNMPGYEQYTKLQQAMQGGAPVISGAVTPRWEDNSQGFSYTAAGQTFRFDVATLKATAGAAPAAPPAADAATGRGAGRAGWAGTRGGAGCSTRRCAASRWASRRSWTRTRRPRAGANGDDRGRGRLPERERGARPSGRLRGVARPEDEGVLSRPQSLGGELRRHGRKTGHHRRQREGPHEVRHRQLGLRRRAGTDHRDLVVAGQHEGGLLPVRREQGEGTSICRWRRRRCRA